MPPPDAATAVIDEAAARRLVLVQALESSPEGELWSAEDRQWAGRAATQALGADAPREAWLAERARLALQRLAPRDAGLRRAAERPLWRRGWAGSALAIGAVLGLASDALLAGAYFNLLSPAFFGLLAWNAALYVGLVLHRLRRDDAPGPLRRALGRLLSRRLRRGSQGAWMAEFVPRWLAVSQPLTAARSAGLLHLAAAGMAGGLVLGLYARALVFDYRAGWATTLLEPAVVHAVLAAVFAPAQALSGIPVPGVDGIAALRVVPGAAAGASAAPWLHLMAITLAIGVLLPRLALAAAAFGRARALAARFPLPLAGPYFDRLRPAGPPARVPSLWLLPHGHAPDAATREALQRVLAQALGIETALPVAEPVPYGDEEQAGATPAPPGRPLVWLDLATTPEEEVHGRLLQALAGSSGHPLLLLDETGFVRRFGHGERLAQRRAAWAALAERHGVPLAGVDLASNAPDGADRLREALEG